MNRSSHPQGKNTSLPSLMSVALQILLSWALLGFQRCPGLHLPSCCCLPHLLPDGHREGARWPRWTCSMSVVVAWVKQSPGRVTPPWVGPGWCPWVEIALHVLTSGMLSSGQATSCWCVHPKAVTTGAPLMSERQLLPMTKLIS